MSNPIRIKGKVNRKLLKESGKTTPHTFLLDEALESELKEKYDADSNQALFYALALDAVGAINLQKDKVIDIEKVIEKRLGTER